MLDAYTIRKIAPRLLFAVIGVNLSIYLCVAAVDITNVVGHGIAQLIRAPFDIGGTLNTTVDQGAGNVAAPIFAAGAVAGFVAIKGSLATIFALMLPVFLIIILAILTLVIRQALIILLTLVAPVAIVLSVLPGTERFFRQWLDLFFRTLIIYPMIAALFAVSDVLTAISFNSSNAGSNTAGAAQVIAGVMFAFMPIALIPFTFRLSGGILGAFSNATGGIRSWGNQLASRQFQQNLGKGYQKLAGGGLFKNTRSRELDEAEDYMKNADGTDMLDANGDKIPVAKRDAQGRVQFDKDGNMIYNKKQESYGFRHRANVAASRAANIHRFATGGWGGVQAASERAMIRQAAAIKESEEAKALAGFDDEMYVLANYGKADWKNALRRRAAERFDDQEANLAPEVRKERATNLKNALNMMDAYNRVGGGLSTRAAAAVELHGISTSYQEQYQYVDENGEAVEGRIWTKKDGDKHRGKIVKTSHDQMQETILRSSGGERGLGNWIAAQSISGAKQAGRYDMAASASAVLMYQEALRSNDSAAIKEMQQYYDDMMVKRITPAQALQGHPRAAEAMAGALERHIGDLESKMAKAKQTGDTEHFAELEEDYIRNLADIAGYHESLGASGSEAVTYFDTLLGQKASGGSTIGELVEAHRNNEIFNRRRREYGYNGGKDGKDLTPEQREAAMRNAVAAGYGMTPPDAKQPLNKP